MNAKTILTALALASCGALAASVLGAEQQSVNLTWPEKPGDASVCLWKGDKEAAFSFTVDDNCKPDHAWWMKLSDELGFKLTWFVITDKVENKATAGFSGSWADWQKLADAGHSIQSHTTNHQSAKTMKRELTDDELRAMYRDSLAVINKNVTNNLACCIAYPRGEAHQKLAAEFAIAARGTSGVPDRADKIDWLCTNSGGSPASAEVILEGKTEKGPKWIHSKPALKHGWAVALYHLVHHGRTDAEREETAKKVEADVREICSHKDRLWIGRFEDVARYGQERDTAKVTAKVEGDKVSVSVADGMDDAKFNFPLTVKVRLPDGWTGVKGGTFVQHDGKPYALVEVLPDRGAVVLSK